MRRFLALGLGGSILSALVFLRAEQVRVKDEVAAIRERQEAASLIIEDMARKPAALAATYRGIIHAHFPWLA